MSYLEGKILSWSGRTLENQVICYDGDWKNPYQPPADKLVRGMLRFS